MIFPTQMHSQTCITAEHHSVEFVQAPIAWLMPQNAACIIGMKLAQGGDLTGTLKTE